MATEEVVLAEFVDAPRDGLVWAEPPIASPSGSRRWWLALGRLPFVVAHWCFGVFSMIVGLAVLATIPILQFASLGYLLRMMGRVTRSGRIRDAFADVDAWAWFGGAVFATWVSLLPLRFVINLQYSAELLQESARAERLGLVAGVLLIATVGHITWAWMRGGRWRHFLWPAPLAFWRQIRRVGPIDMFRQARDAWFDGYGRLHALDNFRVGLVGFAIAFAWLALPVSAMALSTRLPEGPGFLIAVLGGLALAWVLMYLPFLQGNYGRTENWRAGFDWRDVGRQYKAAPWAFHGALISTLTLALPLYVLKAELIPREAAWLPSIVFVISILPTRVLTGWALSRAERRGRSVAWVWRGLAGLVSLPVVVGYVFLVYLTQYVSWYGAFSLYEQHAFLLPIPFVGL